MREITNTDVNNGLLEAEAALARLGQEAALAREEGSAQGRIAAATWSALAAIEAAREETGRRARQLEGEEGVVQQALQGRDGAMVEVVAAFEAGNPMGDANLKDLGKAVVKAADTTQQKLSEALQAVAEVDTGIATADAEAISQLATAETTLKEKELAYANAEQSAEAALERLKGNAQTLRSTLKTALERRQAAEQTEGDAYARVVAYADLTVARTALETAKQDGTGAQLENDWKTANSEALNALAELLKARVEVAQRQLALEIARAEKSVDLAGRNSTAMAAVKDKLSTTPTP